MNAFSTLLSLATLAPVALASLPVALLVWLTDAPDTRLVLPNDQWQLSRVALAQDSAAQDAAVEASSIQ